MAELNTDLSFLTGDSIQTAINGTFLAQTRTALDDLFFDSIETTEKSSVAGFSPRELNTTGFSGRELNTVRTNLMSDEGSKNYVYKDTKGYWTTGVGHLIGNTAALDASEFADLERRENDGTITQNEGNYLAQDKIDTLFQKDLNKHLASARLMPGWGKADSAQRNALVNLDFNMGKWWAKKHPENVKYTENIYEEDGITIKHAKGDLKYKKGDWVWKNARAALDKIENTAVEDVTQGDWGDLAKHLKDSRWFTDVQESRSTRVLNDIQGVGYSPPKYIVKAGDTLWAIANNHNITPNELESLNPDIDPDNIYPGDELNI